jgi:hypothetical protein
MGNSPNYYSGKETGKGPKGQQGLQGFIKTTRDAVVIINTIIRHSSEIN